MGDHIRDIRIISLLKQHYLDKYTDSMDCQYSCLGYYDGMNVYPAETIKSNLFDKKSMSPISEIWYNSANLAKNFNGGFSQQNIGIIRCIPEPTDSFTLTDDFWSHYGKVPFCAIAFLQLKDAMEFEQLSQKIEENVISSQGDLFQTISYCTFDNADLVVFIQSSHFERVINKLVSIDEEDQVLYSHSIIGISEELLEVFDSKNAEEHYSWHEYSIYLRQNIGRIELKISSRGDKELREKLKNQLELSNVGCDEDDVTFYQTTGHENIIIDINNANLAILLSLLRKNGYSTHNNPLYESVIYNIETSLQFHPKRYTDLSKIGATRDKTIGSQWCLDIIKKYQERLPMMLQYGEEGMFSYYQALIQTLNTLSQYERFSMSRHIYSMILPAFQMFDKRLDTALDMDKECDLQTYTLAMQDIQASICTFLESVNSVMLHAIHTDQMYLMIPGYSGTTFSIPTKLSLFYLWLCHEIIELLNDSSSAGNSKNYDYQCLLSPVTELKPETGLISMGLPHGDRLIYINLSQRSLYMPRALMIILAHEIAHYVGDSIRNRDLRNKNIIHTISFLITEGIIPEQFNCENKYEEEILAQYKITIKQELMKYIENQLLSSYERSNHKLHASEAFEQIFSACYNLLDSENDKNSIFNIIYHVPPTIWSKIKEKGEDSLSYMKALNNLQEYFNSYRRRLLSSEIIGDILQELFRIYKESFSDMAAFSILEYDSEDIDVAENISEGNAISSKMIIAQKHIREDILYSLKNKQDKYVSSDMHVSSINYERSEDNSEALFINMYTYPDVLNDLYGYSKKCHCSITECIENKNTNQIKDIREIFNTFSGKASKSCSEIYRFIIEKIQYYESIVRTPAANDN